MNDSIKVKTVLERLLGVKFEEIRKADKQSVRCVHVEKVEAIQANREEIEPSLKYDYEEVWLHPIKIEDVEGILLWAGKCKKCGKAYARYNVLGSNFGPTMLLNTKY